MKKALKTLRKLHKWPGIIIAFLAVLFAISGVVMNHRQLFSGVDVSRNLLPPGYQYENWNLAAVRGGVQLEDSANLIYGNIGVWKLSNGKFIDFNAGFPKGIDNHKIYKIEKLHNGTLVAATQFGLYAFLESEEQWKKIEIPVKEERLTDLFLKQDSLMVMSRHFLLKTTNLKEFDVVQLPAPENYKRKAGLFNTLWELHSGELFGLVGKLLVDLLGLVTIVMAVTGLLHFFFPKIAKKRQQKNKDNSSLSKVRKKNLRWHNVLGYVFIFFLLINTTAGIFLRPPLLIPIATKKVGIIPGTHLDNPNPWHDKLRKGFWDENLNQYIFSTSEGFYCADEHFSKPLQPFSVQPPVSVMGCNVFEPIGQSQYLIGSFSGLFVWNILGNTVIDAFTHKPPVKTSGKPISDHMVTGFVALSENDHFLFEYDRGMTSFESHSIWEIPEELIQKTPISLWNTALEIHTGRIFEHLLGPFYILYVPLAGLCLMMVLVSGFLIWWKAYRR